MANPVIDFRGGYASPLAIQASKTSAAAAKAYSASHPGGGIGGAVGRFLGFDPTPGFNIRNPFASSAPAPKHITPKQTYRSGQGSSGGSGGGGAGGSGYSSYSSLTGSGGASSDPYSQWGGKPAYDSLVSGFNTQKQNIFGTAHDAAANAATGYHGSILDYIDSLRSGQTKIDNQAVQNELAKKQGVQGVMGMVGRGIRSGGVMLANKNAGDSSATQGLAQAYGDLGRRQLSSVGQQYALGQNAVDQSQADLEVQRNQGMRHLADSKVTVVNGIVADARNQLAQLDAQIANASLPDRIAIDQEKERVRQDALGQLQQYDQELNSGSAGIQGSSADARRTEALRLANAGQAPDNSFSYTNQAPAQFQDSGPFASELPLFTFNRNRNQDQLV